MTTYTDICSLCCLQYCPFHMFSWCCCLHILMLVFVGLYPEDGWLHKLIKRATPMVGSVREP